MLSYDGSMQVVPWKTWDEWFEVYRLLFSESNDEIKRGCAKVSAWKAKQQIPCAIEATADLQHELYCDHNVDSLSLAIIRFINGVIEPYKDTNISSSIQNICKKCDIPNHVLTIRHTATHGKMPTFDFAATGALSSLEWLKSNYWDKQAELIQNYRLEINESLVEYFNSVNSDPFHGKSVGVILSFGIPALVSFLLRDGAKSLNKHQSRLLDLIELKKEVFPCFGNALSAEFFTQMISGNGEAEAYFNLINERYPANSKLLEWDPSKEWPETSLGNMPVDLNKDLSLDNSEVSFAEEEQ